MSSRFPCPVIICFFIVVMINNNSTSDSTFGISPTYSPEKISIPIQIKQQDSIDTTDSTDNENLNERFENCINKTIIPVIFKGQTNIDDYKLLSNEYDTFNRFNESILTNPTLVLSVAIIASIKTMGFAALTLPLYAVGVSTTQKYFKYSPDHASGVPHIQR
jgi:hypothetical protein